MTHGLDTSVLLRLLTNQPPRLAANAITRIYRRQLAGDTFFISDLVLSEAYFALQDFYGVSKENSLSALKSLTSHPGFAVSDEAREALSLPNAAKANPGFVDRTIHGDYCGRGYKTYSCEKSFSRLPLTEIIRETDRLIDGEIYSKP